MQVVIPDFDDEKLFAPPPRIHSPAGSASGGSSAGASGRPSFDETGSIFAPTQAPYGSDNRAASPSQSSAAYPYQPSTSNKTGPFRGAALGWHGRTGSGTSDSSIGGSSFRFPTGQSGASQPSGYTSSGGAPQGNGFSFPVKKSSFASLRAAIRGQQTPKERDTNDGWPSTPREVLKYDAASDAGDSTAGRRAALATPRAGGYAFNGYSPATPGPHPQSSPSSRHGRNDSQVSGHSRAQTSGGTGSIGGPSGRQPRYQHGQQSSYFSDSHFSVGAASSSASSLAAPLGMYAADLPPVPPLPFTGMDQYSDAGPSTPGAAGGDPAFFNARAMASNQSLVDPSDGGSPYRPNTARLRDDSSTRRWPPHDDFDEASSMEFGPPRSNAPSENMFRFNGRSKTPTAHGGSSNGRSRTEGSRLRGANDEEAALRPNALVASLGTEGLGQLQEGIGFPDPKAPSEYALNILLSRFISLASIKLQTALDSIIDTDPARMSALGPQVDDVLESLYDSLAHVAKKSAWPVIQSLITWRTLQLEYPIDVGAVRRHLAETRHLQGTDTSMKDIAALLARKKELFTVYLQSKAMIAIAKEMGRDSLNEVQAAAWEDNVFDMLLSCSREKDRERMLPRSVSAMRQVCFETVSSLIGELSRTRFMPISDRFVSILESSTKAPAGKSIEEMLVAAINSMRHLKITVYPMELFEEGAEFVEILSRHFANAHGFRIKSAYAEAFLHLLLPVARSASAEINHPTWIKGIDNIWPRATSMATKPRYWAAAYSLTVALLAVSPEDKFLANWFGCVETGAAKLKDRVNRSIVLNSALRLLWVYVFRCHESASTTSKRLEAFFRIWFPPNRRGVNPSDTSLEPLISMVHIVLFRHFEFGKELVLNFLCHTALGGSTLSLQPDILASQRMTVAIRAILLALDGYVREESPAFPESADFSRYQLETFPEGCGDELPEGFTYPRMEIGETQAQFNDLIGKIALLCDHQVSDMTVFDERTQVFKSSTASSFSAASDRAVLERDGFTWKVHQGSRLMAAYPRENQSYCDLLRACFASWPRCLSTNIAFSSILGVLFRAHFSADPDLSEASAQALKRIAKQRRGGSTAVVSGFMRWIFRLETAFWEIHPKQSLLIPRVEQSIKLWIEFLNIWLLELQTHNATAGSSTPGLKGFEMERTSAWAIIDEVEAYGLFLLCSASRSLRKYAIEVLSLVSVLDNAFLSPNRRAALEASRAAGEEEEQTRLIHVLKMSANHFFDEADPQLNSAQLAHIARWKAPQGAETLKGIAESEKGIEQALWQRAMPKFLHMCLERFPTTVAVFRSYITNRVLGMDHVALVAAEILNRAPGSTMSGNTLSKSQSSTAVQMGGSSSLASSSSMSASLARNVTQEQAMMAEHWRLYILALCTTTTSTEGSRGGVIGAHRRNSSEPDAGERVIAARDLFQKMVPFLASDHARFRDAVVMALGNINENHYGTLLETMQAISKTLTDDFKSRDIHKSGLKRNRRLDRLRTALAQVLQLTSHHMAKEENLNDPKVLNIIHSWIIETFGFLYDREIRQDWEFHKLRRYFCGVTEEFFNGVVRIGNSERFFSFDQRLRMFRVFKDWHSYSNTGEEGPAKLANMLASAAEQQRDDKAKEQAVVQLRNETQALSYHAGCAMAAFCQGSIAMVGVAVPAPMAGSSLEASSLLSWLNNLFSAPNKKNHDVARRALRSLLIYNQANTTLINSTLERCISEPDRSTDGRSFFVVVADAIIEDSFSLPLHQVFCLALVKLGHIDPVIRRKAFVLLDKVAKSQGQGLSLEDFEVGVSSPLPAIYLRAQRDISSYLADRFPQLKSAMLSEYTYRIPHIDSSRRATTLGILPEWLRDVELVSSDHEVSVLEPALAYRTYLNLSNLLYLTVNYSDNHNFEIQDIWSSLAGDSKTPRNADAIIHFLIDQGLRFRNPDFVIHAKRVVSCLSHTSIGPHMFDELCSFVEPGKMIPVPRDTAPPWAHPEYASLYKADLDRMLPEPSKKLTFSPGQLALFFVGEMTYERSEQLGAYLPALLHAIFMHIDSFSPFVQQQAAEIFEQLMRCVVSTLVGVSEGSDRASARSKVEDLFAGNKSGGSGSLLRWSLDDAENDMDEDYKMPRCLRTTVATALSICECFFPDFREEWGAVSLLWAISGPVRHMACRSFQTFRALRPKVTPSMMADMLGRLSDTVSDPSPEIQAFALEILYTLNLVIRTSDVIQQDFLAQSWWATLACLSTTNEREFAESISMLDSLLDKLDIGSQDVVTMLKIKCPEGWEGEIGGLQHIVFRGLRSSFTSAASFKLLCRLAKCKDAALIDVDDPSRLGYLFVAALPWFLQVTDDHFAVAFGLGGSGPKNEGRAGKGPQGSGAKAAATNTSASSVPAASPLSITETQLVLDLAADLAALAERLDVKDLQRVALSISKYRFRTKDDLVRQAVNCLRARFLSTCGPDMAVLLLGETLNEQEWMRRQAMQVLKIFFQAIDSRNNPAFSNLGSELLMPLLRLLSTPLSAQALEVLDEPIAINGGPAANQILRMSLQWGSQLGRHREQLTEASIFGPPEDSGWAVAHPQDMTTRTRINIQAVFKMCELTLDIAPTSSNVNFVVDDGYDIADTTDASAFLMGDDLAVMNTSGIEDLPGSSLGDIVNQLHDLSSFFVDDQHRRAGATSSMHGPDPRASNAPGGAALTSLGLGSGQSLSRQSSLRSLPYKRSALQRSGSQRGDGGTPGNNDLPHSSRSHAQIAKILSRSAVGGRTSGYRISYVHNSRQQSSHQAGAEQSTHRHQNSSGTTLEQLRSDEEMEYGDGDRMPVASDPARGSSSSDIYGGMVDDENGSRGSGAAMSREQLTHGSDESLAISNGSSGSHGAGHYPGSRSRDGSREHIQRPSAAAEEMGEYTIPSAHSASTIFKPGSSVGTAREGGSPQGKGFFGRGLGGGAAFDLREAQITLQELSAGLGAPFEESPPSAKTKSRSPADSRSETASPTRSRGSPLPRRELPQRAWGGGGSLFAKASKTLLGSRNEEEDSTADTFYGPGRFDSVAKSAISNAKHSGDD